MLDYVIIGGDMRMKYLEELLIRDGYKAKIVLYDNLSDITECMAVSAILPVPCVKADGSLNAPFLKESIKLNDIITKLESKYLFGGMLPESLKEQCVNMGVQCFDYMTYEPLTIRNAQATAEGAVKVAIENTDFTLCGSRVLVAGYGRIGKMLSAYLKAFGAYVTVEARKRADLSLIESNGFEPMPLDKLYDNTDSFDIIFNTVPYKIFTEREIVNMNKNVVYIELASLPGGIDEVEALRKKIKLVKAASLPGKTAPETSAAAIKDAVLNMLKEGEV